MTPGKRMRTLQEEWEKLNLTDPSKFGSLADFEQAWTKANQEQADSRFNRKNKQPKTTLLDILTIVLIGLTVGLVTGGFLFL